MFTKITLLPKKERSLKLFHPWLFSGAIAKVEGNPGEGDIVEVFSHEGNYLATGHFHNGSIKVRVFSFEQTDAGEDFWIDKLRKAFAIRKRLNLIDNSNTNTYRLVHGEGDNMPGLIIDIYNKAAIIQAHTIGMHRLRDTIKNGLISIYKNLEVIYDKSSETLGRNSGITTNSFLEGDLAETVVMENELKFMVNWVEGQKTGFFLDQRDNRRLLQNYSEGKKVLNAFSYSGGFSMYALKGGASLVHSVDSSKKAVQLAEQNAQLNNFSDRHTAFDKDVFDFLKTTEEKYDIIILDPPAFAKHLSAVDNAMIGYRNLNTEGIRRVAPGGMVFTFSCSQVIDRMLFRKIVFQAAAQAKRNVRIIHQLNQAADHPINIYHPEGEYLKGIVMIVD